MQESIRQFIARNVAWLVLRLLAPKEFAAMEEPREVLVMLPVSGRLEKVGNGLEQQDQREARTLHKLSAILSLYLGRTRMQEGGQSGRETARTGVWYPRTGSYRFVPDFSMLFSGHARKPHSGAESGPHT